MYATRAFGTLDVRKNVQDQSMTFRAKSILEIKKGNDKRTNMCGCIANDCRSLENAATDSINPVNKQRDLGITITNNLSWSSHIKDIL